MCQTAPAAIRARDFSALVHKLYFAHGLSTTPRQLHPGTLAERQAIQRQYKIRRGLNDYTATPCATDCEAPAHPIQ